MTAVWLHVGANKTGTSAIQSALAARRDALAAAGLVYPRSPHRSDARGERGVPGAGNAVPLAEWLAPQRRGRDFDSAAVEGWLDRTLDEAGDRPVLFSSEAMRLAGRDPLAALVARFRDRGRETRIIFLVRHLLDYAVAQYAQGLKGAKRSKDPDSLYHARTADLAAYVEAFRDRLWPQLRVFAGAVGDSAVTCRLYDAERADLPRRLLGWIDPRFAAALGDAATDGIVNRSPTAAEMAFLEALQHGWNPALTCRLASQALLRAPSAAPGDPVVDATAFADFAARNQDAMAGINARFLPAATPLRLHSDRMRIGTPLPPDPAARAAVAEAAFVALAKRLARRGAAGDDD